MELNQRLFAPRDRYTRMMPLSYMVPTFYPTPPGAAQPQSGAPQIQLHNVDLQSRAQRMVNTLYWTAQTFAQSPGMADAQTLKVFMAPEFYFRCASPDEVSNREFRRNTSFGSYPEADRLALAQALLGALGESPLFRDWVIVAGSVCSLLPGVPGQRMNLLNTAIMLRGARAQPDGSEPYVLMEKHYISNIDGPPQVNHANLDPTTVYSFRLNPDQFVDNLVYWDGMMVGLEVCLDHSQQVLVNAMNNLRFSVGPDVPPPDLQLVTSCGMDLVDQAVAVRNGGLVFLTDGMSHAGSGLQEPEFRLGRYIEDGPWIEEFGQETLQFQALPATADYQVDYFHGVYQQLGRRQGVWCGKQPLPLTDTATSRACRPARAAPAAHAPQAPGVEVAEFSLSSHS